MIRYCCRCVMPDTKPDLRFNDEGVCSACTYYEGRQEIDYAARKTVLIEILERYRSKDRSRYDCIVPVSGGKDSTFQVLRMLELGYNPLCVTATTDHLSAIGRRNIENLKRLGVDYIEVSVNPKVRRRINRLTLDTVGDISWPEHVLIFTIPVRIAVQMNIPLIVWGENSQHEYGGPAGAAENNVLNRRWLEEFGGLLGLRVSDLVGQEDIEQHHMIQYTYPSDDELKRVGVTGIFGRRATAVSGGLNSESCNLLDRGCEFAGSPNHTGQVLGGVALPAYFRVDLGLRKEWEIGAGGRAGTVALFGTLTNLLNRRNLLNYSRDAATGRLAGIDLRPRAPLVVGLDWQF